MTADLHVHTSASDGRLSPDEVIRLAEQSGLKYIAITDHDTTEGVKILERQGKLQYRGLTIIPGIEFSAACPGHEIHILGLQIDYKNEHLQERLNCVTKWRRERLTKMVDRINIAGYPLSEKAVIKLAGATQSIGRAHIARALVEAGQFKSVGAVFTKLLDKGKPAYVSHYHLEVAEIIELVHAAGGKAVLAHPVLVGDDVIVQNIIKQGIDGIEVYHPRHDAAAVKHYRELAKRNGLLISGGSDFHAIPTRYPEQLGVFVTEDCYAEQFLKSSK